MSRYDFESKSSDRALCEYRGVPNETHASERSRWRRFLEAALPWLGQKWGLAERLAEAKVRQEMAQAHLLEAQAAQEALKTIEMATRMEAEKLLNINEVGIVSENATEYDADLRHEISEIKKKIEHLGALYGTRFEFRKVQDATPDEDPSDVSRRTRDGKPG